MIAKLRGKAGGMARPGFGGDRFKPEDGRHFIRILPGYDYNVCDGGPSFELFQHWFKIDGKTRPFYCGARTMMGSEHDNTKCRLCQTWELLGQMEEACDPDSKDQKDFRELIDATRKKFSFRSSSVMNIVVRGKGDAANKAMVWGCPPTVAQQVLNTIADNMEEDEDFDPFDEKVGWDWILTRTTENKNTSYTITLKTKSSALGEFEGEITDLDKMFENEVKQSTNERNTTAIDELITNMLDPIFELADQFDVDLNAFREGKPAGAAKPKPKPDPKPAPKSDKEKVKEKSEPSDVPAAGKSTLAAKPIDKDLPPADADDEDEEQSGLDAARDAVDQARLMFEQEEEEED